MSTEMQKVKVSVVERVPGAPTAVKGIASEVKYGPVTAFDKAKYYYKWLISAVSVALAILVENQDLVTRIFGASSEVNGVVAAVILILGNIGLALKENEKWVNKLPGQDAFPHPSNDV